MSEDNSAANTSASAKELQALLDIVTARKNQFNLLVDATTAEITESKTSVTTAKGTALTEIEQSKAAVAATRVAAEAILAEIDKTKTAAATAKGAVEATQKSATNDLASINESKVTADKLQAAAVAQSESLISENNAVSEKIEELRKKAAPLEEILTTLTTIKGDAEVTGSYALSPQPRNQERYSLHQGKR